MIQRTAQWISHVLAAVRGQFERLAPSTPAAKRSVQTFFAVFGVAAMITTLVAAALIDSRALRGAFLLGWAVIPPLYFWYEYFYLFDRTNPDSTALDKYKYGQEVSRNIWLGVLTAFTALFFVPESNEKEAATGPAPSVVILRADTNGPLPVLIPSNTLIQVRFSTDAALPLLLTTNLSP